MKTQGLTLMLAAALTSTAACALTDEPLDDEVAAAPGDRADSAETLGSVEQALTQLHAYKKIHFGGTIFEETHYETVGGVCSSGHVRVNPPDVIHEGHGSCWFDGWVNASNPNDCRARIRLNHSAGWLYGDCYVWVFEETVPDPDSCEDSCGGRAPGGCWCDSYCTTAGDCCDDYAPVCNTESCWGGCGGPSPDGTCWCDTACTGIGDCCDDYSVICE